MISTRPVNALLVCLTGCGLLLLPLQWPGPAGIASAAGELEPPVNITADRMEFLSDRNIVVFSGNALAVREDVTISAETMEVSLADEGGRTEGSVEKIVATGNVNFRQRGKEKAKDRFATGQRGEYVAENRVVTLSGEPRLWEGKNVITAEKLVFFLDEQRFVAEGKVGLTVFPEKAPEDQ